MSLEVFKQYLGEIKTAVTPEPDKLRFVNWYLTHGCNLSCDFCKVPHQSVKIMDTNQRQEVLGKLKQISSPGIPLSIFGGEPTINPNHLIESVRDATNAGFFVCLVSNGWRLSPELIDQLANVGLRHLALSIDSTHDNNQEHNAQKLILLDIAKDKGIVPVVNTIMTKQTDLELLKQFVGDVLHRGLFVNPLVVSPEIPGGAFSSAPIDTIPNHDQLREFIPWLAWQKVKTGRVTPSFGYLKQLYDLPDNISGNQKLWHCAPHLRSNPRVSGRGYLTLDSNGYVGPCQEFPRIVNLLNVPSDQLSLNALDSQLSAATYSCPGCLFNCYFMEEDMKGPSLVAEIPKGIQMGNIYRKKHFE